MKKEIIAYHTREGREPFTEWLDHLSEIVEHRVKARLDRVEQGNYGDHKRFQSIIELRLHFGKGYRIYCAEEGAKLVILLVGGDKSSQRNDINKALGYWRDYYEQKKI
jgi:putative addiction module killer protein